MAPRGPGSRVAYVWGPQNLLDLSGWTLKGLTEWANYERVYKALHRSYIGILSGLPKSTEYPCKAEYVGRSSCQSHFEATDVVAILGICGQNTINY